MPYEKLPKPIDAFDENDPARQIHAEFDVTSRPLQTLEDDPALLGTLIEDHKKTIEELLADDSVWEWQNRQPLLDELEGLMKLATESIGGSVVQETEKWEIADLSLGILAKYNSQLKQEHSSNSASGWSGFDASASQLAKLYMELGFGTDKMTLKQEAPIIETIIDFDAQARQDIHASFVDKYKHQLVSPDIDEDELLGSFWRSPQFLSLTGKRTAEDLFVGLPSSNEEKRLMEKTLEAFGFNSSERLNLWMAWHTQKGAYSLARENIIRSFGVMGRLSARELDMPHKIFKEFGINHFGRYEAHTLLKQYSLFHDDGTEKPASVILAISPNTDHNGAFSDFENRFRGIEPIFMESSNLGDMARRVVMTKKKIGPISSLVIAGHGTKDSIRLGEYYEITQTEIEHSLALEKIHEKNIFTPGAEIILMSCSTGVKDGIATTLSRKSAMDVIAPTKDVSSYIRRSKEAGKHEVIYKTGIHPGGISRRLNRKDHRIGSRFEAGKRRRLKPINIHD